ncbi:hypothetical protein Droror1_Dr00015240, partial [Drosera rotundifolia]
MSRSEGRRRAAVARTTNIGWDRVRMRISENHRSLKRKGDKTTSFGMVVGR